MTNISNNQPTETLRDDSLKASIWSNPSDNSVRYNVELVRSYTDAQGKWHDSRSLSGSELLRGARLLERAYDRVQLLRTAEKATDDEARS